ncbi:sugar transferase [Pseudonocardia sp. KRD291]|uniref:sugar transferase n=1 Tax=Pseudonocardia sp. KRD291 TaxID=2792007 RepID=UPI001C4A19AA|nr:sugar transferase [Pseudonocardia sp. KRD291]MBW0101545.1 sugar transferase [Pseudonocardia sp. KRD291]
MAADVAAWACAVTVAVILRLELDVSRIEPGALVRIGLVAAAAQLVVGGVSSVYNGRFVTGSFEDTTRVAGSAVVAGLITFALNTLADPQLIFLSVPLGALPVGLALTVGGRVALRVHRERRARCTRAGTRRVIVFGSGHDGRHLVRAMLDDPSAGCVPVALLDDDVRLGGTRIHGVPVRGTRWDMWTAGQVLDADLLVVTGRPADGSAATQLSRLAAEAGMAVAVVPPLVELVRLRSAVAPVDAAVQPGPTDGEPAGSGTSRSRGPGRAKRLLDVLVCSVLLLAAVPVMAVIALVLRVTGDGQVLYRASRVGRNMRPFTMYKFSGMVPGDDGPRVTTSDDIRITPVGRRLRASKLDELPQLFNVLRGDMSLVGPRPEDPRYVSHYTPEQQRVLTVRPGMTGLAFLRFGHEQLFIARAKPADVERYYVCEILPRKLRIELEYLENWSFVGDLRILARTLIGIVT